MWTLLKILLFGATVVVHPGPIEVGEQPIVFTPPKPLDVVTSGAFLEIDVTSHFANTDTLDQRFKRGKVLFPNECAQATVISRDGKRVVLTSHGIAVSKESTYLLLTSETGVPTDLTFVRIEVKSQCAIRGGNVRWKNAKL